ncbi:uncharacterized protein LOC125763235 [Anopheles funestus]|uniref:uncharacterized protein LOC125763235 n=1 Tax=Anopheles funestus TaxID=62324 RepID=UPI0020C5C807|nr:uncharacterized protein LOC125763235 [Anopheles funestus]
MFCHRFTIQCLISILVLLCYIEECYGKDKKLFKADQKLPLPDITPLTGTLHGHIEKFKQLRDDLKALQNSKADQNPMTFFRETMRIMQGLQALGKDWKDIEQIQNSSARDFQQVLEEMDPMCGQIKPRAAVYEIKLRCMYTNLGGNPYYIVGPLKQEQVNRIPFVVDMYHDFLTQAEVKHANETRQVEPSVRRRLQTVVPNLFNVAVREAGENGYNGSHVKHRGYSMVLYLESYFNAGVTIFPEGIFTVSPRSGSLVVTKAHPSICPSSHPLNVITNFDIAAKKQKISKEKM